jgi:hypothetical protein
MSFKLPLWPALFSRLGHQGFALPPAYVKPFVFWGFFDFGQRTSLGGAYFPMILPELSHFVASLLS